MKFSSTVTQLTLTSVEDFDKVYQYIAHWLAYTKSESERTLVQLEIPQFEVVAVYESEIEIKVSGKLTYRVGLKEDSGAVRGTNDSNGVRSSAEKLKVKPSRVGVSPRGESHNGSSGKRLSQYTCKLRTVEIIRRSVEECWY